MSLWLYAQVWCMWGAGSGNIEVSSKAEQGVESLGDVPWQRFLQSKALWGLVSAHCSFGVGPLVCLSWLPSYYSDVSPCLFLLCAVLCCAVLCCAVLCFLCIC